MSDWNTKIIEEFRQNDGKVGGQAHQYERSTDRQIPVVVLSRTA